MNKVPVHQSLITTITIMGVPRSIFWANALITMDLFFLGAWWLISIGFILHIIAVKICKSDPEFFDLLKQYCQDRADYLEG